MTTDLEQAIQQRRTFAIISHPDAGKTTMTEKLLLLGGAIQTAGSIKAKKSDKHATSDWMAMEKERGISVTTSVMQFSYGKTVLNLLDTPGHADFSEDTYRTLTAVDSALMIIDAAKGVEARTRKLLEICRMRQTPIITFMNKLDRDSLPPLALIDEVESELGMACCPMTWPVGSGRSFHGVYDFDKKGFWLYADGDKQELAFYENIDSPELELRLGHQAADDLREEILLVQELNAGFDQNEYTQGNMTPVFFGSAMTQFGVEAMLAFLAQIAPCPQKRATTSRDVLANEAKFSGFVFKIQANMDPKHRDRIAFLRICSGRYFNGIKAYHVGMKRDYAINQAHTFVAGQREHAKEAWPGDIIGIHNHGALKIGDTLTEGEKLQFTGIPNFAPELFRRVVLKDPLKQKALQKGLVQLSEEGAMQVFRPLIGGQLLVGAVGVLQFDVVAYRLANEYQVDCAYESCAITLAKWVEAKDKKVLDHFIERNRSNLSYDAGERLVYLAPSRANCQLVQERFPDITFSDTCEHAQ